MKKIMKYLFAFLFLFNIFVSSVGALPVYLLDTTGNCNAVLGDVNGDGDINIADATYLQMYLAEYDVVLGKQ